MGEINKRNCQSVSRHRPGCTTGAVTRGTGIAHEAIAIAQELGMKPLLERVLAKREILKA